MKNTLIANYANSSYEERKNNSLPMEKFSSFHDSKNYERYSVVVDIEINEAVRKCDDVVYCIIFIILYKYYNICSSI